MFELIVGVIAAAVLIYLMVKVIKDKIGPYL